jgi:signal transduction histidine kinase
VERKKLEAQNRQLQKTESLGRMAGAIAHYFNNQLGAVIANLELAMTAPLRGANPQAEIVAAMKSSYKAAEMSGLMLAYVGQSMDKREPLDLSETCHRNLPMLQAMMPKEVMLKCDFPSPGPVITSNASQMFQVLTHLTTNASEAMSEGQGTILLRVKTVPAVDVPAARRFPMDWHPQSNVYACLEVMDTGSGIEDKDIEKLFDPFFSSKFTGRGMGLAVVLGIARSHSGAVAVESEPGKGSTFRVFFPVCDEAVR